MRCSRALTFTLVLGLAGPASANVSLVEMTGDVAFSGIPFSFENPGSIELHASVTPPVFGTVSHSVSNDVHVPATVSVEEPRLRLLSASVTSAFDALSARLEMRGGPALPGHRINREYAGFRRTGGAGRPTEGVIVAEETGALAITLDYTVLIHLASDLPPPMGGLTMGGQNTVCGSGYAAIYLPFRPAPARHHGQRHGVRAGRSVARPHGVGPARADAELHGGRPHRFRGQHPAGGHHRPAQRPRARTKMVALGLPRPRPPGPLGAAPVPGVRR